MSIKEELIRYLWELVLGADEPAGKPPTEELAGKRAGQEAP